MIISYQKFCLVFKVKISEKASLLEAAEGKISELTAKVDEQQKLIAKLEDDILKVFLYEFHEGMSCDSLTLFLFLYLVRTFCYKSVFSIGCLSIELKYNSCDNAAWFVAR